MTGLFEPGQNGPLTARSVRFTATASAPLDLCALVVDDRLRVGSSDDVVFYNQPTTTGVRLDGECVVVELDTVRPGARVLCAVGCDRPVAVDTRLHDDAGTELATFHVEPATGTETAVLCWEIYRRNGSWKIRALGSGYAGGFAEMFPAHGVDVDDENPPVTSPSEIPLPPVEMLWRIFEDAARSAAACTAAHEFAQHRLDDELSAAVADPARRAGPEAEERRARAHRRYDEVVDAANARYRDDSAVLAAELVAVDATLPPALASWDSPTWTGRWTPSDGVRVGEVSVPDLGAIRIPLCLPVPFDRPLWIDDVSGDEGASVSAIVVRLLAARPGTLLHVVDPGRCLSGLTRLAAAVSAGPPVDDPGLVTAKLTGLADAFELDVLARRTGAETPPAPVVVVAGVPHGFTRDDSLQLLRLAELAGQHMLSLVIAGSVSGDDPALRVLSRDAEHLPASADGHLTDPWTGGRWAFTPDRLPTDTSMLRGALEHRAG